MLVDSRINLRPPPFLFASSLPPHLCPLLHGRAVAQQLWLVAMKSIVRVSSTRTMVILVGLCAPPARSRLGLAINAQVAHKLPAAAAESCSVRLQQAEEVASMSNCSSSPSSQPPSIGHHFMLTGLTICAIDG